jgi:YgiT-type zinc finger domain-containing protein
MNEKLLRMPCSNCGGRVAPRLVSKTFDRGGVRVRLSGFRALVCENCGWEYLEPGITQAVLDAANAVHRLAERSEVSRGDIFGAIEPTIAVAAAELGRRGGSARSKAKARAVRENGKKGGRPKRARNVA